MTIKTTIIPTGRVWVDPGGPFGLVPRALWSRYFTPNENQMIAMDLNSLLIQTADKNILVDTGLGDKLHEKVARNWGLEFPEGTMLENLAKHGLQAGDIDIVIDTHLHSDHCGGNTTMEGEDIVPTFPNATYYVQAKEYHDATHTNVRTRATYLPENFVPLKDMDKLVLLDGDAEIVPGVRVAVVPGHTPGIQAVIVEGGDQPIIFVSDMATYSIHLVRTAWVTAYDVEPLITIATKEKWQPWILENNARVIFQHDVHVRAATLAENEQGRLVLLDIEPGSMPK